MLILSDLTKRNIAVRAKIIFSLLIATLIDQYSFFHFLPFQPSFTVITLFFWSFFYSQHISFIIVFFLGLLTDIIGGSLLGENTFVLLAFYAGISFYREYFSDDPQHEWAMLWGGTVMIIVVHFLLIWTIHKRIFFSVDPIIGHFFSVLFYPGIKKILLWIEGGQA